MVIILNSKNYPNRNQDLWWFNLSSPDERIKREEPIVLNLNDTSNNEMIGRITLRLDDGEWYSRIMRASRHLYKGREITKVHVVKERGSTGYHIYFGKKEDGYYPVIVETGD